MSKTTKITLIVAASFIVLAIICTVLNITAIKTAGTLITLLGIFDCIVTAFFGGVIGYIIRDKYIKSKNVVSVKKTTVKNKVLNKQNK